MLSQRAGFSRLGEGVLYRNFAETAPGFICFLYVSARLSCWAVCYSVPGMTHPAAGVAVFWGPNVSDLLNPVTA